MNPDRPSYESSRKVLVILGVTFTQKMKPLMALKHQEKFEDMNVSEKS